MDTTLFLKPHPQVHSLSLVLLDESMQQQLCIVRSLVHILSQAGEEGGRGGRGGKGGRERRERREREERWERREGEEGGGGGRERKEGEEGEEGQKEWEGKKGWRGKGEVRERGLYIMAIMFSQARYFTRGGREEKVTLARVLCELRM